MKATERIQRDYDNFIEAFVANFTVADLIENIESVREVHFVMECYEEVLFMAKVVEDSEGDSADSSLDVIIDFEENVFNGLYDFFKDSFDGSVILTATDYGEVVTEWFDSLL